MLIGIADVEHGQTIVPPEVMHAMSFNDGAGLQTQKECDCLASAMEEVLDNPTHFIEKQRAPLFYVDKKDGKPFFTFPVDEEVAVTSDGKFVKKGQVDLELLRSPWSTTVEHVRQFIEFLRGCGGFEVW
jgi:hypothetical protein